MASWSSNGNNQHSGTCSVCMGTVTANCSGGTANCTTPATCSTCKQPYGTTNENHMWSAWETSNGKHIRTCAYNAEHSETGDCDHKAATCLAASVCTVCKHTYAEQLVHSYTYSVNLDNPAQIIETCTNGCDHNKTATLQLKSGANLTYTGSAIEPMEIIYPEGWVGEKVQPDSNSYRNNVNAGQANCTVTYKTATVSHAFTITANELTDSMVTLSPTNGTYTGSAISRPAVTVQDGTAMTENDYTISWPNDADWTNAGTITVMVTGQNNYTGTVTRDFSIGKATPTADDFTVNLPTDLTYNGEGKTATAEVKSGINGMGTITVKYNGSTDAPVNAGAYTVTVDVAEGGNYNAVSGIELGSFTIGQANGAASVSIADWVYGDAPNAPVVSSTNGTDAVTYLYKVMGADDSTYIDAVPTLPGDYTVKASFPATTNYKAAEATADFTISKRPVTVKATDASKTYGGTDPELEWTVTSGTVLASDPLSVNISREAGENAGDYTITFGQDEGANPNYDITFVNGTLTIHKASLTVIVKNQEIVYGDEIGEIIAGFDGFIDTTHYTTQLDFSNEVRTSTYKQYDDVGTYPITVSGITSNNYEITYVPGTLTVKPKPITVTIADKTSVYGEKIAELSATDNGIVNNDENVYSLATTATSTTDVGFYAITGTALDGNYTITFVNGTYTITKAPVNSIGTDKTLDYTAGMEVDLSQMFSIDENAGAVDYWITDLTGEGSFTTAPYLYRINKAGTFTVKITTKETANYNSGTATAVLTVKAGDPGIGAVTAGVVNDTLDTSAIVLTRENTDIPGTLTVDEEQTLAWGDNTIRYTFTPNDTVNYKIVTGEVAVTVADTIAPAGTVTVSANSWAEFLNNITFGLFFKETQTVAVAASDNLSGVAKIEYIESKTPMDLEAVKAADGWKLMDNGSVSVTLEDTKQFIYYIRITDKSGNIAYLSTDGAEYDTSAPVIAGVDNGVTYYTTQKVTVTDKNIDTITVNGEAATGIITLEGNKEGAYTIVATDKASNSTTVTVTMKPIKELAKATENLGNDNVTSADTPALEALVEKLDELLDDDDVTDAEQETLEQHKTIAESLIQVIEDTANQQKAVTDKKAAFNEDAVKSTDKAELKELAEDVDALLDTNNLTQDERIALETLLEQVEDMTDTIDKTAADSKTSADAIDALDPDTVKSTDKALIEKAQEVIEKLLDGDHLTASERDALEDAKDDAEVLLEIIDEAAKAADTDNTAKVEDVTADNVTPEDKSDLEKAKADLEDALENNGGNYTEEEKKAIEDEIQCIEDALETLENVEAVEDTISDLPATVEPDDEETVAKIEEAKKSYDELTDYEKSLVDEKVKEKLDKLTTAAVAYAIVKGNGGKWSTDTGSGLSFTANGPISKFVSVEIDGKVIDTKHYSVKAGSTIITLNASYLETLSVGEHTITVVYTDGETDGTFRINPKSATPATGDSSNILLWTAILFASVAAMAVLIINRKKFAKYGK